MNIFLNLGWAKTKEDFSSIRSCLRYRLDKMSMPLELYERLMKRVDRIEQETLKDDCPQQSEDDV